MRIIPKKIKVKNAVWQCYSMTDILAALVMLIFIFICVSNRAWVFACILAILTVIMFMPTQDGILYTVVWDNVQFLFAKKQYSQNAKKPKEDIHVLTELKEITSEGLIKYTSGAFGRVIKLGQKNFGLEDENQQNNDIRFFQHALDVLDVNQSADIVRIDRPVNLDEFSKEMCDKLLSVNNGTEDKNIRLIKSKILRERTKKIDALNNITKQYISDFYLVVYGKSSNSLENTAVNIAYEIGKCGIETQILTQRETAVFLKYSYTRNFDEHEVLNIPEDKLVEWITPKEVKFKSNSFTVDGVTGTTMAVTEYPLQVGNGWGALLFDMPNTKTVMHIKPVEKYTAIRRIDKCINDMTSRQITAEKASEANSAEIHRQSLVDLLDSLQSENENLYDVTFTITAYNYDNNQDYKRAIKRELRRSNFKSSTLYGMQINGYKTANISPQSSLKKHINNINSSSLAAVFPFVWTLVLDKGGIILGENSFNNYPFSLNIWKRGNLYQNSNAFVIGKSGAGKSFFLKTMIANEWANDTRIIVLDPEKEYVSLTHNLYGNVIDVGNAKEGRINPFHIYSVLTEDGTTADSEVTFNTHLKMLESFYHIVLAQANPDVIELINNLTVEMYARKGITEKTDCSNFKPEDFPIFSDLMDVLKSKKTDTMDELTLRDMRTAELYLEKFVSGRYSDIWNAPSTLHAEANLIDFNFQSLFANKNNVVANAQMLLIFRFIEQEVINARERNKNGDNVRTLVITDEAHMFIDAKYPIALDFFYSMNKRIRKYNGAFIPATQNIADWNGNEELRSKTSTIIKNSQYTFIFKLSSPDMKDVLDIYNAGDSFNEEEKQMIISAVTGQAFFIGSTELRESINIEAGDYVKSLFEERTAEQYT